MTIYASVHTNGSPRITGVSVDSGFKSFNDVIKLQPGKMIPGTHYRCLRYKIDDDTSLLFSDFAFYLGDTHENV